MSKADIKVIESLDKELQSEYDEIKARRAIHGLERTKLFKVVKERRERLKRWLNDLYSIEKNKSKK